jgi:hypothetical protein
MEGDDMPSGSLLRTHALAVAIAVSAIGLVMRTPAVGAATVPACPASIDVAEAPSAVPPGYRAFINGNPPTETFSRPVAHRLDTIMFSDGPPTEMAWLAPSSGGRNAQRWEFSPAPGAATWLSCGYLATSVIVSIPLPSQIRSCRVVYDPATAEPAARSVACR